MDDATELEAESELAALVEDAASELAALDAVWLAAADDAVSVGALDAVADAALALPAEPSSEPVPALLTGLRSSSSPGVRFLIIRLRLAWSRRLRASGSVA